MKKGANFFCIKNKLITAILIFMLVPIICITYYMNYEFKEYLKADFIKSTTREIIGVDNEISMYLDTIKEEVEFLANNKLVTKANKISTNYIDNEKKVKMTPSKNGGIEEKIYNLYSQFGKANPKLKYVVMATTQGSFVQWPEAEIDRKYDPRVRMWYKAAIENKGKVTITSPYYYEADNISIISIVKTIQDSKENLIGVQGVDISLKQLTDMFKNIRIGEKGYIILVDNKGTILAHSKNDQMNFKNIKELNIEKLNNIEKIQSDNFETNLDGKKQLINIYTSPKTHWKFISVIEKSELLQRLDKVQNNILLIVELFVVIAIIISIIFSHKFLKPILVIERHLKHISSGNFKKKIPEKILKRKDELGTLSVALEAMQNRIENLVREIKNSEMKIKENFNFLQTLMDAIPNPIFSKDEHGVYNHCNIAFTEYVGIKREEFIGSTIYKLYENKLAETYHKSDKNLMEEKGTRIYESKLMHNDGTYHYVTFSKATIVNEEGDIKGLVSVIVDITEQKKNREKINKLLKLKEAMLQIGYSINEISNINNVFQLILEKVIDCVDEKSVGSVLILDKDKNLKIAVAKGYDVEKIRTFNCNLQKTFAWIITGGNINKTIIVNDIDKIKDINMLDTEEGIKIKSVISAPIIIDGQLYGFVNLDSRYNNTFNETDFELMEYMRNQISIAISKHKLYEETVYLSRYDKLTNVYNRSYFEQLLYSDSYKAITDKKEFFVVIFDLNRLKLVNDNYGHLAGDELIKIFSRHLSSLARDFDIIARFGGDEFSGVFFNVDSQSLINRFEELIEHFKNNPIIFEENKIICSYSYGIANFPKEGKDFNQLIKIADERMYEYKSILKSKKNSITQ